MGVLTGHFRFNRHLHLMSLVDSALCDQCGEAEETALHYIGECPAFARLRILHLGSDHLTYDEVANLRVSDIVGFTQHTGRFDQ